jgi:hypothetical protein
MNAMLLFAAGQFQARFPVDSYSFGEWAVDLPHYRPHLGIGRFQHKPGAAEISCRRLARSESQQRT